jgi:hypothetical protein
VENSILMAVHDIGHMDFTTWECLVFLWTRTIS